MGTHAPGLHCPALLFGCTSCDAFSLPFFHTLNMILLFIFFPAVPCRLYFFFYLCFAYLEHWIFCSAQVPVSSGTTALFNQPHKLGKQMCRTYRASIAVAGSVRMASTTWEVGSVQSCLHISRIPGVGKHLPTPYNFASLQAMKAWILSAFCILRWKACYGLLAASVQTWSVDFEVSRGLFA